MSQYGKLAKVYDYLMSGVDYNDWADYIFTIAVKFGLNPKVILDLACGTGNSSLSLAKKGYQVIGVDISPEMLEVAKRKAAAEKIKIEFIQQDMRQLKLPYSHSIDMVTAYQDGLNYMLEDSDLLEVLKRVYQILSPGGLFIFDINSVDKLPASSGETTCYDEEQMTLIWESSYDKQGDIWEIVLTGFLKRDNGYYEKFKETHREKYHTRSKVLDYLKQTGYEVLAVYNAFTLEEGRDSDKRLYYVARKGSEVK
ncbi:class I SAM-dependent DNA methyltransferase [Candidatus Contubernalis alkaliaceticus]|uniref:class I SAM-dependent DNA methyltransferase n=1 Tax=Candidatus Contubernalis alkaliaceticus TaxID=338645 RepID=UPI001F4C180F|nr:class I SAM-dependent methyltransferase [Candidatus Contubernalis alkalaceticus]UNC91529.1 methyltransferase domain-containing protein [Candidatus Contubernalis alkalaceticus]